MDAAILAEKADFATKCLSYEPNIAMTNSCGENILHSAVKSVTGQKISKLLIRKFPELLTVENVNEWTPIHLIAAKGWLDDLQEIYAKYPKHKDLFFKNVETGRDVIFEVVQGKHFETAEFLLEMHHKDHFTATEFMMQLINLAVVREKSLNFIEQIIEEDLKKGFQQSPYWQMSCKACGWQRMLFTCWE